MRGGELINAQTNADGLGILSGEALTLTTGDFNNQQGQLQARNLDLTADNINNQAGSLVASERINLKGTTLDNTQGLLSADGGSASLTLTDQLTNRKGTLQSQQALALQATSLDNDGGKVLSAASQIVGQVSGALSNLAGSLLAGTALDLHAAAINNQQGVIAATHGDNHLTTTGLLNNQGGDIESSQRLTLDAAGVDNHGGQLLAGDAMQISADGLTNSAGLIQAGDALSIDTRGGVLLNADTLSDTSGIRAGGALTLSAGDVDNRNGLISGNQLTGQGLTWNNQGGEIDSLQTLNLSGTALSNGKGLVSAGEGDLTASFTQTFDNQQGTLQSSQNLRVAAATLNNSSGTLLAKNALQLKGEKIDNPRGVLQSGGSITLTAGSLDNQDGAVSSQNGALDVNVAGAMNNQRGILQSTTGNGLLTIGGPLDNQQGSIIAHGALTLSSGDIDNRKGALLAGSLDLTSQQLNNQAGLIQGRDGLSIDTHGNQLDNSETQGDQTGLRSGGALNLTAGDVNNRAGLIAGKLLKLVAQGVNNQTGAIDSAGLTASVDALNNTAGLLFAIGDAQVTARQSVQNQQGLIKAGQALNLSASEIDNQNTRGSGQGIEAQDLALNAASLNNQQGALRAGDALQASISKQLNNQNGLISSQNSLTVGQPGSRPVLNNGGDIVADGNVDLWLGQLDGGGRIVSGGDLSLDSVSALNQSGTLAADGDFTLNSHGNALTNSGTLSAGHQLNLTTGQLSNQQSGDINAATTHIDASGIFNQGVIDGGDVLLHADRLHNTGMGRLYGDRLTLDARTLLNDKTGETAATIAARGDLTIATDRLSNQDHGLIYSNGGLSIGGRLNDAGQLTGQAARVENLSATIEAMGDVHIDAAQTENRDTHLTVSPDLKTVSVTPNVLEVELCSGEKWNEGCGRTDGQHYRFKGSLVEFNQDGSSPVAFNFDKDGRSYAFDNKGNRVTVDVDGTPQYVTLWQDNDKDIIRYNLPGVSGDGRRFNIFSYQQSVKEQEVSGQDSAVIRSGGDLTLSGSLHNKDSQLVAGQDLRIHGSVDNDETTIRQVISKDGVVVRAGKRKAHRQTHFEGQGVYQPPLQETDVPLHLTVQQRGQGAADGRTIAQQQPTTGGGGQASALTGAAALAQPGQQTLVTEVALPPGPGPLPDGNGASGVPIQKTAEGLTKVTPSDAAGLTATPAGNVGTTQDGAQPVKVPPQDNWVLRSVSGPVKLPDNSLFMLHPGSDSHYLVETDPRFTDGKRALSSSAFYSQDQLQKRLGDGDYEQLLVRNQVMKATGQRWLSGFSDDEDQYRALLASGRALTERFGIMPGVDLTAEQMAQVTGDMVIMVNLPVTLADGSTQVVSVPKLYARVQPGSLKSSGSLLAGNNVRINTADKVINGGSINGRELTSVSAGSLLNSGDISGNLTRLVAAGDIVNRGGQLKGGEQLALQAGKDILSLTGSGQRGSESWLGRQAGIAVTGDGGALSLNAGHDIQLTASVVSNRGSDSTTRLRAGHDILLDTATTRHATDYTRNDQNYDRTRESREVGSTIDAGGSLMMQSGHDMTLRAASVTATQDATLLAGHDLSLQSGEETWDQSTRAKWTKHHFLSKTTTKIQSETHQNGALSSTLSGDTVTAQAGHDMTMSGSNIAGTHDVTLSAGHNLTLTTAAESSHTASVEQKKKSGFSGTGGLGFSLGHSSQKLTHDDSSNVQKGSVAGSSEGSLTLLAGNAATVHGSDLVAGQDMTVQGKNVSITTAENSHTGLTQRVTKSSGLTLSLGGTVGSALNTATQQVKAAHKEEDGRLAALKGTQAALTGYSATQAARLAAAGGSAGGDVAGLSLSLGRQRSASEQRLEERTSSGSRLQAGRDMHIAATGGDLSAAGAQLKAGRDMTLSARRDITLTSGQNSTQSSSHNRSHGGSVGMGVGGGSGSAGLSASLSANHGRGHENGSSLTHAETTADAGRTLSLSSGRDAALQGAQLSGEAIRADIGRDLQIASEQESSRFDMKQTGGSAGLGVTWGAGSPASASASGSRDKMHSRYDSVQKQSGLFAGKGGFDVSVGNHAQLDGGVIGSTATADKNKLDTGTLGFSNIENKADYEVEHQSVGVSSGGSIGSQFAGNMANGLLVGVNGKGSDSSTTQAAVSDGSIIIRDKDAQKQDVGDLSRDVEHANQTLSPIFDKEKEQNRLKEAQLIGEIGSQAADIARTQGELSGLAAAKEKHGNLSADQLRETQEYKAGMQKYGTGSALQQGIQAATAAVQGLAGGDLAKAIAGGSAPYIAEVIKQTAPDEASRVMAHAVVAGVLAQLQGNSAAAGAVGAASAAVSTAIIAKAMYGTDDFTRLDETQKQTISALATLASGLAGGLAGGDTASVVAGGQAGKNTSENNDMGGMAAGSGLGFWLGNTPDCDTTCKANLAGDVAKGNSVVSAGLAGTVGLGVLPAAAQVTAAIGGGANALIQYAVNGQINYTDALIASWVGAATLNTGLLGTVGWNAAGGATSSYIKGDDPLSGAIISGGSAGIGYGLGQAVKGPLDKVINPNWKNWEWVDMGMGVSKPMPLDPRPAVIGNIISSGSTEGIGQGGPKAVSSSKEGVK
ncbi:filamentous hemagglutinin family outer membrane protein [Klebsiella pneumoniae]|nr:filamentous hemagglutinin family outer membrane protein [Klebsiella pneumoniae]